MEKNDLLDVKITDMTADGEGVGKADAFPLFIKDACVGDIVRCKVMKLKKTYGYARLMEVLSPSPDRVEPLCPKARACGGCQLQMMSFEAENRYKTKKVRENLRRIGGFTDLPVEECIGMPEPWHYRNKAQVPFGYDKNGKLVAGFYAGHSHDIIDMEDCALTFPEAGDVIRTVKNWMLRHGIRAYEEETGKGLIRHVLIRKGFSTGEILVCLIANGRKIPASEALTAELLRIPGFHTLSVNVNTARNNVILGTETYALYGPGYIEDTIKDIRFRISPESFYQVNPAQTEVLYGKALEFAELTGKENVWDLYCGIGTISLFLAEKAKKVYGVEIVPRAIDDARENARLNGFTNAEFYVGAAEEVLPAWHAANPDERIDVISVDPPRKGLDPRCIETILDMQPERIVYVSCDSATLARDLKILADGGYSVDKVQPVNQFGRTVHVESVVLLSRTEGTTREG